MDASPLSLDNNFKIMCSSSCSRISIFLLCLTAVFMDLRQRHAFRASHGAQLLFPEAPPVYYPRLSPSGEQCSLWSTDSQCISAPAHAKSFAFP